MISPKRAKPSTSASHNLPSSPAETATSNDYLLTEILLRLPVKSLLKFKSVSKHWLSLITSPYFASKHNPRAISGLFFRHPSRLTKPSYAFINISPSPRRAPFTSLNFVHDPFGIRILQSCNGLMLCCSNRTNNSETNYYVYNPTTKQHTVLPELSTGAPGSGSRVILGVNLAFDPIKSPDYKVICLVASSSVPYHYQIEIYSSTTGPWRPCGSPFATPSNVDFGLGVFWNGSIHWPSVWGNSLYFDVDKEQVRELPMPVLPDNDDETFYRCRYFGESGGHLHFMELDISNALHFDVYELEMNYSGWFIKYKVDLNPIAVAFPETIGSAGALDMLVYEFSILAVVQAQTDEDSYLVLQLPHLALRYNFRDGTFCKICDLAPLQHGVRGQFTSKFVCFEAYQFIESLACV